MSKTKLYSPNLSEFIYHTISGMSQQFLFDRLEYNERKMLSTESKIRKFSEQADKEVVMLILSKLGIHCGFYFFPSEYTPKEFIFASVDGGINAKKIISLKGFATSVSKMVTAALNIENVCNSNVWGVSRKYLNESGNSILKKRKAIEFLKADQNVNDISEFLFQILNIKENCPDETMNHEELCLLLYLYNNSPVKIADVNSQYGFKPFTIRKLFKSKYVQKVNKQHVYAISTPGKLLINDILQKLHNKIK